MKHLNVIELDKQNVEPFQILKSNGFKPFGDLNYCTNTGINYYVGFKDNEAAIVALIEDEDIFMLDKVELREMSYTAKHYGIERITLFTNYGCDIHSKHETPSCVGLYQITKIMTKW